MAKSLRSVRKNGLKKKNGNRRAGRAATRARGTRVLAQGVAALPSRPFGAGAEGNTASLRRRIMHGLNARLPLHLGLPRPVGPYQVIRTSKLHTSSSAVIIFAPIMHNSSIGEDHPVWYHACGVESVNGANPINGGTNTRMIDMPLGGLGSASEAVPAALTVQVMNRDPLQSAAGIFTMGRVSQQLPLGGESRTWNTFKTEFDSYFKPRLLSGGKLALRGVTANAYPINMSEFADFLPLKPAVVGPFTWDADVVPGALSPVVFTQDGTLQDLTFLVTIEWRVRFDPFHPAAASHTFHPYTPDGVWNSIVGAASAAGHGVVDIADEVAEVGFDIAAVRGAAAIPAL